MAKQRRTVLSGIALRPPSTVEDEPVAAAPERNSATSRAIQQTLYLPPAVHEQLRELAFQERVKMHAIVIEGLDAVFLKRGLRSIADLTGKS